MAESDELREALIGLRRLKARVAELQARPRAPIAIVGTACRFPGGIVDLETFASVVASDDPVVGPVPRSRWEPARHAALAGVGLAGTIGDLARFDADLFRISHAEARAMDPQQRVLLETAWRALEDAGQLGGVAGSNTGVYLGVALSDWDRRTLYNDENAARSVYDGTGVFRSVAAGRLSYAFDLRGPNISVDTACSSSLVAVQMAVDALRAGQCDLALAGGVNLLLAPDASLVFHAMGALAPDGRCKTFDAAADGYVRSEGVGVVVLRRLDEALAEGDRVLAVIRGGAINQDGRSNGLTAPNPEAQRRVVEAALANAGLSPAAVGYVEAHGTGTPLGDPIEVRALREALGTSGPPVVLGAVKSRLGHAEAAAGVAGLLRAVTVVRADERPAHRFATRPNPALGLGRGRLTLSTAPLAWDAPTAAGRVAGVSAFGMSGTNAHLIVEAPPPRGHEAPASGLRWLRLSAPDPARLDALSRAVADALDAGLSWPDAVATGTLGRRDLAARRSVVAGSSAEAAAALRGEPSLPTSGAPAGYLFDLTGSWEDAPATLLALAATSRVASARRLALGEAAAQPEVAAAALVGLVIDTIGLPEAVLGEGRIAAVACGALAWDAPDGASAAEAQTWWDLDRATFDTRPGTRLHLASAGARDLLQAFADRWDAGAAVDGTLWVDGRRSEMPGTTFLGPSLWIDDARAEVGLPFFEEVEVGLDAVAPAHVSAPVDVWRSGDGDFLAWLRSRSGRAVAVVGRQGDPEVEAAVAAGRVAAVEGPWSWRGSVVHTPDVDGVDATDVAAAAGRDLVRSPSGLAERRGRARALPAAPRVAGRWLVIGGAGALGRRLVDALREAGASEVVAASRHGELAVDVLDADAAQVLRAAGPWSGVVQAAGSVDDAAIADGDGSREATLRQLRATALTVAAEVAGTAPLVVVGSASVWLGIPGQAAYASAHAADWARCRARHAAGLPTSWLGLGPIDLQGAGMASAQVGERLARWGITRLSAAEAVLSVVAATVGGVFGHVIHFEPKTFVASLGASSRSEALGASARGRAAVALEGIDAQPAPRPLADVVLASVAAVLGRADVPRDRGLFDLGLDSMGAVALVRSLGDALGRSLPSTLVFDAPTVDRLIAWLEPPTATAKEDLRARDAATDRRVAIVGVGMRLPAGIRTLEGLADAMRGDLDGIRRVPADRWDADAWATPDGTGIATGGFLDDVSEFDPEWFGISPREAEAIDPVQRLALLCAVEALDDAGAPLDRLPRRTGVWLGVGSSDYGRRFEGSGHPYAGTGSQPSFAAGRLAYHLGVQGPAVGLDTACSSALVAVHLAARAVIDGEVDLALAGGVHAMTSPETTAQLWQLGALSPTGRCHTFDASADGYARGEGCGVVVLKRLADAEAAGDRVLGVLLASGVGHDGEAAGLTVPSGEAQRALLAEVLASSGVAAADVALVETHGTGTRLGDPIEVAALQAVYGARPSGSPIHLSAIKARLGHAELAAGVVGVLAALAAGRSGFFPPVYGLQRLNPEIPSSWPVAFPRHAAPWASPRRIAAISSFGLSGTNAHAILEAYPASHREAEAASASGVVPLLVSGRTRAHALVAASTWAAALRRSPSSLASLAAAACLRAPGPYAIAAAGSDAQAVADALVHAAPVPAGRGPVVWLLTGQGSQYPGMGLALAGAFPEAAAVYDLADDAFQAVHGRTLRDVLAAESAEAIARTEVAQPAIVAASLSVAAVLRRLGAAPDLVLGHSVGELAAAAVAGVFDVGTALRLAVSRGARMGALPAGGGMAQVGLPEDAVRERLLCHPGVEVAAVNTPFDTVVSGRWLDVEAFLDACAADGVRATRLLVSHAFHAAAMDPMLEGFGRDVATAERHRPTIPLIAASTGRPEVEAWTEPAFWLRAARGAVRFADAVASSPVDARFVEIGPHPVLSAFVQRVRPDAVVVATQRREVDGVVALAEAVALHGAHGLPVDRAAWWPTPPPRAEGVPPTAWRLQRVWVDRVETRGATRARSSDAASPWHWRAIGDTVSLGHAVPGADDAVTCDVRREDGVESSLRAVAAAARQALATSRPLSVLADGRTLAGAAALGFVRALHVEHPDRLALRWNGPLGVPVSEVGVGDVRASEAGAVVDVWRGAESAPLAVQGTWWVVGGTGAVGRRIAAGLVAAGADRVVVSGRRPAEAPLPERCEDRACDVTDAGEVQRLVAALGDSLGGVVHAAGRTEDALFASMDDAAVCRLAVDKAAGVSVLLDVLPSTLPGGVWWVGSAAAALGWRGQTNYAAANGLLDAAASMWAARGGVGGVVHFGPWSGGGLATSAVVAAMASAGMRPLSPDEGWQGMAEAMAFGSGRHLVAGLDVDRYLAVHPASSAAWGRAAPVPPVGSTTRVSDPEGVARSALAAALGIQDPASIDPDAGLFDLGLDSLSALVLARELRARTGQAIADTIAFDAPSVRALARRLAGSAPVGATQATASAEPIALVGFGCRFPGGVRDLDSLWEALVGDAPLTGPVPRDRWRPRADAPVSLKQGRFVDDVYRFDAAFFGLSPREARWIDPQQRLLLEVAWEALEGAGIAPDRLRGERAAIYVGIGGHEHEEALADVTVPSEDLGYVGTGNDLAFAAGRLAFVLGTTGPAVSFDTACSSSLVAVHEAVAAVRRGDATLGIAAGVRLLLTPTASERLLAMSALSPSDACHTFDASADGYARGEGVGVVVVEPLSVARAHGHRVLAVVAGSAVGHDGAAAGLTVPHGAAQVDVLRAALADAGVTPADVDVVEAHGTGTKLGDPIEVAAWAEVFGDRPVDRPLRATASKARFGHAELAAGMLGIGSVLASLSRGQLPPVAGLRTLNPSLPTTWPWLPVRAVTPWPAGSRRRVAGVSGFGLSGTNAHVVIAEAPAVPADTSASCPGLWVVSASEPAALDEAVAGLEAWSMRNPEVDPAQVAETLARGRASLRHRHAVVVTPGAPMSARPGAVGEVRRGGAAPKVAWLFTGQGAQVAGMGRALAAAFPVVRETLEEVDAAFVPLRGSSLQSVMFASDSGGLLDQTAWTQPALFAYELAVARLWASLGVTPSVLVGHSIGEIAAAAFAGACSVADATALVEARGRGMQALPEGGGMAAVAAGRDAVAALLEPGCEIAAINAPDEVVVSGDLDAVARVVARAEASGVRARSLTVSHAFHAARMTPMLEDFRKVAQSIRWQEPIVPMACGLTGRLLDAGWTEPERWVRHVREPVRFADAIAAVAASGVTHAIEVGPVGVLTGLTRRIAPEIVTVASGRRGEREDLALLEAIGAVHVGWQNLQLEALFQGKPRARLSLPTTPWRRTEHRAVPEAGGALRWVWDWQPLVPTAGSPQLALWQGAPLTPLSAHGTAVDAAPTHAPLAVWIPDMRPRDALDRWRVAAAAAAEAGRPLWTWVAEGEAGAAVAGASRSHRLESTLAHRLWQVAPDASDSALHAAWNATDEDEGRVQGAHAWAARLRPAGRQATEPAGQAWPRRVLVLGGTGGIGRALVASYAARGVEVVVASRRAPPVEGARAHVVDITDAGAVASLITEVAPDRIVHAAAVLADRPWSMLSDADWDTVWAPRVDGLRNVLAASGTTPVVVVGSATAWLGAPGQVAYGAAQAAVEAMVREAHGAGRDVRIVALGPVSGEGMAASLAERFAARGVRMLTMEDAVDAVLHAPACPIAIADADWSRQRSLFDGGRARSLLREVSQGQDGQATRAGPSGAEPAPGPEGLAKRVLDLATVAADVASVLGVTDARSMDLDAGFFEMGFDSLMTVQLVERLERRLGRTLGTSVLFDHPTVRRLAAHLTGDGSAPSQGVGPVSPTGAASDAIAVVGIALRFPGAGDLDALWALLRSGGSAVGEAPPDRWPNLDALWDPTPGTPGKLYTRAGAFLDDITSFDPGFYGISPREAEAMDPQQRLLLDLAWDAIEDAGDAPARLSGTETGVFVGLGASEYDARFVDRPAGRDGVADAYSGTGNDTSFAAGRIAWRLGLQGPAMAVNTACSASLVAVHLAMQAIRTGECGRALVGGVNLMVTPDATVRLSALRALSPTGACHAFRADADGYVRGEGGAMLLLQRLDEALAEGRRVYAVLTGSAVNHDGASSALTTPNGRAQTAVLQAAWRRAGIKPSDLGYVEAHGTGTKLGDPIEARALATALGDRQTPLPIGSVKANLGHLELAAGIAGLIKAILVVSRGERPPHPGASPLNPDIPASLPLTLLDGVEAWPGRRVAGVSAFGLSGTNAHVVVESAPPGPRPEPRATPSGGWTVALAARDPAARDALALAVASALEAGTPLAEVAPATCWGRISGHHRIAAVGDDPVAVVAGLRGEARQWTTAGEAAPQPPRVLALFSGVGADAAGWEAALSLPGAEAVREVALPAVEAAHAEPAAVGVAVATTAAQVAMARAYAAVGVAPDVVVGHGAGEIAAAVVAGALGFEEALALAAERARVSERLPAWSRVTVLGAPDDVLAVASRHDLVVVAMQAADAWTFAGPRAAVDAACTAWSAVGAAVLAGGDGPAVHAGLGGWPSVPLRPPTQPWASSLVGGRVQQPSATLFAEGFGGPIRFAAALQAAGPAEAVVEIGLLPSLLGLARRTLGASGVTYVPAWARDLGPATWRLSLATLWTRGVAVDWTAAQGPPVRTVALPQTPRRPRRCWVPLV